MVIVSCRVKGNSSKTTGKETPPSVLTIGWVLYDCFHGRGQLLLLETTVCENKILCVTSKRTRLEEGNMLYRGA